MARLVAQSKRLSQFWEMDQRAGENNEGIDVKKGGANSPSAGGVAYAEAHHAHPSQIARKF